MNVSNLRNRSSFSDAVSGGAESAEESGPGEAEAAGSTDDVVSDDDRAEVSDGVERPGCRASRRSWWGGRNTMNFSGGFATHPSNVEARMRASHDTQDGVAAIPTPK